MKLMIEEGQSRTDGQTGRGTASSFHLVKVHVLI